MITDYTSQQIVNGIDAHIRYHGGTYSSWYCGISADANDRLLNGHSANSQANAARYWDAGSEMAAREIEKYFLDRGCQGGGGGGYNPRQVYVYRISPTTRE